MNNKSTLIIKCQANQFAAQLRHALGRGSSSAWPGFGLHPRGLPGEVLGQELDSSPLRAALRRAGRGLGATCGVTPQNLSLPWQGHALAPHPHSDGRLRPGCALRGAGRRPLGHRRGALRVPAGCLGLQDGARRREAGPSSSQPAPEGSPVPLAAQGGEQPGSSHFFFIRNKTSAARSRPFRFRQQPLVTAGDSRFLPPNLFAFKKAPGTAATRG